MPDLFVDTSAWFAFFDRKSRAHDAVADLLSAWTGRLIVTDYVVDELLTLVRVRAGHWASVRVGEALIGGGEATVVTVEPRDFQAAWDLFREHSDKDYSFTDCTSFVVMRRLGIEKAAALDQHFRQAGFEVFPSGILLER